VGGPVMPQFSDVPQDAEVLHAPGYSDLPEGAEVVGAESNADKLRRILKQRATMPERKYTTVRSGAEQSLTDLVDTFNPIENIKGIGQFAMGAVQGMIPRSVDEMLPSGQFRKMVVEPMIETQAQANRASKAGLIPEAGFKSVAATVPMLGPAAAAIYDKALAGEPGQGMGQGQALIATLAAPEMPVVKRIAAKLEGMKPQPKPTPRELAARSEYAPNVAALRERITAAKPKPSAEPIAAARQQLTERIAENIKETHAAAKQSLDARWGALKEKVGNDIQASPDSLAAIEESARSGNLSNATPASLAEFEKTMARVREPEVSAQAAMENQVAEAYGYKAAGKAGKSAADVARGKVGADVFNGLVERLKAEGAVQPPEATTGTFGDLRARYTRLGEVLAKGGLEGDVYHALEQVRDGYGAELQSIAERKGAAGEYSALKGDWSQYMQDFYNADSPVAQALRAKDLPKVTRRATGDTYARFAQIMGRNKPHGGNPVLVQELAGLSAREAALKAMKAKPPVSAKRVVPKPSRLKVFLGGIAGAGVGAAVGHPISGYYGGKEAMRAYLTRDK